MRTGAPVAGMKPRSAGAPSALWDDSALVEACLRGDERAWEAILEKYKKLIYSVPMRYRFSPEDAADIFQAVCVDLFTQLEQVRNADALRGWLVRVAANKCYHWKRKREQARQDPLEESSGGEPGLHAMPAWTGELEREQIVREALAQLSPRCQTLIRKLFFGDPPPSYESLARDLGLATGSIGFIRGRCLKKLARALENLGL